MKRQLAAVWMILALAFLGRAEMLTEKRDNVPAVSEQEVNFLTAAPAIDGVLDRGLETLPARQFGLVFRDGRDEAVPVTYRIAYGTEFLYVYLEAKAEHLTFRDRAYQNGDGFLVLIGRPQPGGEATDEFYELACSAVNLPEREWQRRIFWNYNVDTIFRPTSLDTRLEFHEEGGKIGFELLLPWVDVRPYHPWLSEGIGFNISFCKAVENGRSIWYQAIDDDSGSEFKKRRYAPLRFQKPSVTGPAQTFVSVKEGHVTEGQPLDLEAVTVAGQAGPEVLHIHMGPGEGLAGRRIIRYDCAPGLTRHAFTVDTAQALEGGYSVRWSSASMEGMGAQGVSVLPAFDAAALNALLEKKRDALAKGSLSTIQFMVQETEARFRALKPYETCTQERLALVRLNRMIDAVNRGEDPLVARPGFLRKAFRSKIDGTLQPYMVYLPEGYDKGRKYPLMVFLHGSASDESSLRGSAELIPPGFIAVGPLGRGKSNAFCRDHAQEDISEAIAAVAQDYSVDPSRILLAGFSMGGYGVYRTFYETPSRYRALAVFSGGPDLGGRYAPRETAPDFTDEKNLIPFRGVPLFIFHGGKDLNVSLPVTREVAAKLEKAGARVELRIEPDKGHERPGPESLEAYRQWVQRMMK